MGLRLVILEICKTKALSVIMARRGLRLVILEICKTMHNTKAT